MPIPPTRPDFVDDCLENSRALRLALPDHHNVPTKLGERQLNSRVSRDVGRELRIPETYIGLWRRRQLAPVVSMPIATVYEHRRL